MAPESESPLVAYTLKIISASDLPARRFKRLGERNAMAKVVIEGRSKQTKNCMCSSSADWNDTFQIEARKMSSVLSLRLSSSTSTSLNCSSEINISELLQLCRYGKDAELDLRGIKSGLQGRIKVCLSLSRSGSWSDEEAQHLALVISQQPSTAMTVTGGCIDAVDGLLAISFPTPPAMAAQSIQNVLGKLENFMRIAGAVAEVHPYAKGAWEVLSAAYKIILAQVAIDQSVSDLFQTMQDVYGFVDAMEAVTSRTEHVEKIIKRILIQTAECGRIIQEYSCHGFGGRLLRENMGASTPAKVAAMEKSLTTLHGQFDTSVAVHIAVVCFRIQTDVTTLLDHKTLDQLRSCAVAMGSLSPCLPGTRRDIIDEIHQWALHPSEGDNKNVFCLHGVAGIGKSAVAATVATHFAEMGRLGAFVNFNRASPEKQQLSTAVNALALQMAASDGRFWTSIVEILNDRTKALVLRAPLAEQFNTLIVKPLASISTLLGEGPIVIVLDGLYEYEHPDDWASILELLVGQTESLPSNIRFIITGRTVNGIHDTVTGGVLHPRITIRELRFSSHSDIFVYFTFRMEQIRRKKNLPADWPGPAAIVELTDQASGFFAWAVSASNFIDAYSPPDRLKALLLRPLRSIPDPNTPLDELYKAALNSAGDWTDVEFVSDFRAVMGAIIESPTAISTTDITRLTYPPPLRPLIVTVRCLGSLLMHGPVIHVIHPSFLDFLSSRERCGREIWHFENRPLRPVFSAGPAKPCLRIMNADLKRNMGNMTLSATLTTEVLPLALVYVCQSWADSICTEETSESRELDKLMVVFIRTHLLHWFEAMSLMKKSEEIVPMLHRIVMWLEENTFEDKGLKDLVIEAINFYCKFAVDIAEHPLYVYCTALPLLPSHSILYQLFHDVLVDPSVLHVLPPSICQAMAFSTDGLQLVTGYKDITVWDTVTGAKLLIAQGLTDCTLRSAAFSCDGARLACGTSISTVYVWDSVSGAQVIGPLSHSGSRAWVIAVAWSTDGEHLLSGGEDGQVNLWNVTFPKGNRPITTIRHPICAPGGTRLISVALSSDGSQIASGSAQGNVHVWDSKTGGIVWSVQEPQGADPWLSVGFLSSDVGAFVVVKIKRCTQTRDASSGNLCPLPDSLTGEVGLKPADPTVNLLMQSIKKHRSEADSDGYRSWATQGEYFACQAKYGDPIHIVRSPKSLL